MIRQKYSIKNWNWKYLFYLHRGLDQDTFLCFFIFLVCYTFVVLILVAILWINKFWWVSIAKILLTDINSWNFQLFASCKAASYWIPSMILSFVSLSSLGKDYQCWKHNNSLSIQIAYWLHWSCTFDDDANLLN